MTVATIEKQEGTTMEQTALVERADAPAPAVTSEPVGALTPMQMAYQLIQGGADLGSVKEMLAMSRQLAEEQARRAFDNALSEAKAEIPPIFKNRVVDFTSAKGRTNYRHEDLGEIAKTVDPILARHGLSYRFRTEQEQSGVRVVCVVAHREGHSEENALTAPRDDSGNKNSIQQIGSTITYLQRYTLKAALGLAATNDDDGKSAGTGGVINEEQLAKLKSIAEEVGGDVPKLCKHFKVEALADLPASRFAEAVGIMELKRRAVK
jgi:hypothetical protein